MPCAGQTLLPPIPVQGLLLPLYLLQPQPLCPALPLHWNTERQLGCRGKAPQLSPLALGNPLGAVAMPYPPPQGGDGELEGKSWAPWLCHTFHLVTVMGCWEVRGGYCVPYPPPWGGDGELESEQLPVGSLQRGLEQGHKGPYLGTAEWKLQDAQGHPGWQQDKEHRAWAGSVHAGCKDKMLVVRFCPARLLARSRAPALTGIYQRRVPVCLLVFPLAETEP